MSVGIGQLSMRFRVLIVDWCTGPARRLQRRAGPLRFALHGGQRVWKRKRVSAWLDFTAFRL